MQRNAVSASGCKVKRLPPERSGRGHATKWTWFKQPIRSWTESTSIHLFSLFTEWRWSSNMLLLVCTWSWYTDWTSCSSTNSRFPVGLSHITVESSDPLFFTALLQLIEVCRIIHAQLREGPTTASHTVTAPLQQLHSFLFQPFCCRSAAVLGSSFCWWPSWVHASADRRPHAVTLWLRHRAVVGVRCLCCYDVWLYLHSGLVCSRSLCSGATLQT